MAKMIGLSRAIKREWLDKTVDMVLEGMNPEDIKNALREYVSFELNSQDNIRKSCDILMNLWVHPFDDEASNNIRIKALEAIRGGNTDRMAFHWCMFLLYYPVFVDVTGTIGKLSSMQDAFTLSWLKEKIYEQWGERTTMVHSLDKIMQTIRQLGAVNSKAGVYTVNHYFMTDEQTRIILMKTILALKIKPYYEPAELASVAQMFPFEYEASSDIVFGSQSFELGSFGGNPVVVG